MCILIVRFNLEYSVLSVPLARFFHFISFHSITFLQKQLSAQLHNTEQQHVREELQALTERFFILQDEANQNGG